MSREMSAERWACLKALKPAPARYFHIACFANMVPDPRGPGFPAIPFVERSGVPWKQGDAPRTDPRDERGFKGARR